MKNSKYLLLVFVFITIGAFLFFINKLSISNNKNPSTSPAPFNGKLTTNSKNMKLTSSSFENNGNIPTKYTCDGEDINPPLLISQVPQETLSLALVVHDPDAPIPGGFTHWILYNLNPQTKEIQENFKPTGSNEGKNSSGKVGWMGPCPPSGTHHYHFILYALDEILRFDSPPQKADLEKAIAGHILEQAELVGLYQRQ